jgi:hypothetical protein
MCYSRFLAGILFYVWCLELLDRRRQQPWNCLAMWTQLICQLVNGRLGFICLHMYTLSPGSFRAYDVRVVWCAAAFSILYLSHYRYFRRWSRIPTGPLRRCTAHCVAACCCTLADVLCCWLGGLTVIHLLQSIIGASSATRPSSW